MKFTRRFTKKGESVFDNGSEYGIFRFESES